MKRIILFGGLAVLLFLATDSDASNPRFRGGAGGFRGGAVGGGRAGYGHAGGAAVQGPFGGGAYAGSAGRTVVGPGGGARVGASGGGFETPRGGSVEYGRAGGAAVGPRGGVAGGAVGGVQVTTPGGREVTKVGGVGGAQGPRGYGGVGGFEGGAAVGPGGVAVGGRAGGVGVGPGGVAVGGRAGGVGVGPGGVVAGGRAGGAAVGPYGGVAGGARVGVGVGAGVGVGGVRHGTYYRSASTLRTQAVAVRTGFNRYDCFSSAWYRRYPGYWYGSRWTVPNVWYYPTWGVLSGFCGYPSVPLYYDYGSTIVYNDDQVLYNGDPLATADQFNQQALDIANTGRSAATPETDDWQPLGVFALVQGDEQTSYNIFQLAVNKQGTLRGNYYNALADTNEPVYGSVDKASQRAAWSVGDKKTVVYEAGVANLTQDQTTVLVHFDKDKTQQFSLVRIEKPEDAK